MFADLGILGIGAIDVPRGSDSTDEEIKFILAHADCSVAIAENVKQADKILKHKKSLPSLERIILFDDSGQVKSKQADMVTISSFSDLRQAGEEFLAENEGFFDREVDAGSTDDIATLIYTSGTTGDPKGVMLSHRSFIFQLDRVYEHIYIKAGDVLLSVLPVWHSFERAVEYVILNCGAALAYSKPVGSVMLPDMEKVKPQWLASVPRIWEGIKAAIYRNMKKQGGVKLFMFTLFVGIGEMHAALTNMFTERLPDFHRRSKILDKAISILPLMVLTPFKLLGHLLVFRKLQAKLGGRFIAGISGGGALPPHVDRFFQAAGILLLEGYGLTETGPILAVRKQNHPVTSTVGPLLRDIEHRVVSPEGALLPAGEKGTLHVKSPQIMDGYYKRPDLTEAVLKEGWLDTGDVAVFTHSGDFKILGRTKETIVLLGGENIEPVPIEDKLNSSDLIQQSMVVGQDKKFLAALIVPDMEKLEEFAVQEGISYIQQEELLSNPEIQEHIHNEIQRLVNTKNGFKHFECIYRFTLLPKPFEVGTELTHTMKIRRDRVGQLYHREIEQLFV
jgi:long-chain acyl-CoA synthetase